MAYGKGQLMPVYGRWPVSRPVNSWINLRIQAARAHTLARSP